MNKTSNQLANEKKIQKIIENIINNIEDENGIVDDSYYTFSNDTYNLLLEETENKKLGKFSYNSNNMSVDRELLLNSLDGLKVDNLSISEQTKVLTDTIDTVSKNLSDKSSIKSSNEFTFKTDIINFILTRLMTTMSMVILSPKIMYLFSMTSRIFGIEDEDNVIDFIKN